MRIEIKLKLLLLLLTGLFVAAGTTNLFADPDSGEQTTRSYKDDGECQDE